jgi:hypothetical protein
LSQAALTGNPTLAAVASGDTTTTPPASWTERQDASQSTPTTALEVCTRDSGFTGTTITFGATQSTVYASMAIELDSSVAPTLVTPTTGIATAAAAAPTVVRGGITTTPTAAVASSSAAAATALVSGLSGASATLAKVEARHASVIELGARSATITEWGARTGTLVETD